MLAGRRSRLFAVDMGSSVCGGHVVKAVSLGYPATTWTADAGVVVALAGRCHPPVLAGKCGFKLKKDMRGYPMKGGLPSLTLR